MNSTIKIIPINKKYTAAAKMLLQSEWSSTRVVTKGRVHDCMKLPAYIAVKGNKLAGMITYYINDSQCEIITLNCLAENEGIGQKLIECVKETAARQNCTHLAVITTNDNIKAIRYYQKRGFSLKAVYINAINQSRLLKPEIPLVGNDGIPILHEVEFEMLLGEIK